MRAYALNGPNEYFAELTEAYFGKNDFYPFNRDDLKHHDPDGFRLVDQHGIQQGQSDRYARLPEMFFSPALDGVAHQRANERN